MLPLLPFDMNANTARRLPAPITPATPPSVAPAAPKGLPIPAPKAPTAPAQQVIPGATFTTDELTRLVALRDNYTVHAEYLERDYDECRLEFARWLFEHGKLNER